MLHVRAVRLPSIYTFLGVAALAAALVVHVDARDRWKLADDGSCYFDAEDSGPDQCAPTPGRFKLDASGACYFDETDAGPNQCGFSLQ